MQYNARLWNTALFLHSLKRDPMLSIISYVWIQWKKNKKSKIEKKNKEMKPNRMYVYLYKTLLKKTNQNRFLFFFSASNPAPSPPPLVPNYTQTSQIWPFFSHPTFIFISSTVRTCQAGNTFCHSEVQSSFYQDNP